MSEHKFQLSENAIAFVHDKVEAGEAESASEVVEQALAAMRRRDDVRARKLAKLRALIQEADDAYDAGDYIEVHDIRAWLDGLGRDDPPA